MYLVMDLMKKGDLFFHLCRIDKKNGRFFQTKAIKKIAYELLIIIEQFHSMNIIFRNLRPENIFIKDDGKLAVSDFLFSIDKSDINFLDQSRFKAFSQKNSK
jgi:serine/threonine protein kinase